MSTERELLDRCLAFMGTIVENHDTLITPETERIFADAIALRALPKDGEAVPVHIVCDWINADPFPRFIEAETPEGKSISIPWHERPDGLMEFRLYLAPAPPTREPNPLDMIVGLTVSMDVSKGEDDSTNRIFGTVYSHQDGDTILATEDHRNFKDA